MRNWVETGVSYEDILTNINIDIDIDINININITYTIPL
jgi:hypothetical protein